MTAEERKQAWDNLQSPKPSWETFKRLLCVKSDPEEARQLWLRRRQKHGNTQKEQ